MKISIINQEDLGAIDEVLEVTDTDEIAAVISSEHWAPAEFTSRRLIKDLVAISLLVLDVDDGCTLDTAREKFKGFKHIIATSRSHQKEKNGVTCDRFRVVLFLQESLSLDADFKATWQRASKLWPFIDPACKDSSRFFYPSPTIISINRDGLEFAVSQATLEPVVKPVIAPVNGPKGDLWKSTLDFLVHGAPSGARHIELVKAVGNMREQGYSAPEAIDKIEAMTHTGDWTQAGLSNIDLKTIERMYQREMKYGYRPKETEKIDTPLIVTAGDLLDEAFAYLADKDKVKGDPTGIDGLDRMLGGGFRTGEMTVLMAQAKTGKNTLYHDLMYRSLQTGAPFAYASRELNPATEVMPNLLSIAFGMNAWKAEISEDFKTRSRAIVSKWALYFAPGYGYFALDEIDQWMRQCKDLGVNHFLFDHFHYALEHEDHDATSTLIRKLKQLTKELDIHLSLIVQPRGLKENEKLSLATLRGGAVIGQALDNLLILQREPNQTNISRLTLEAARHKLAKLDSIYLQYDPETTTFIEVERDLIVSNDEPSGVPKGLDKGGRWNGKGMPRIN